MKPLKQIFAFVVALAIAIAGWSIVVPHPTHAQLPAYAIDPCQYYGAAKSSVAIILTSATTTELVAAVAGKQVFVCGFVVTMVGAAETIQFEQGTKTTTPCDTGASVKTGAMADGTVSDIVLLSYPGSTVFSVAGGNEVCAITTGTVSIQGVMTYVQQ